MLGELSESVLTLFFPSDCSLCGNELDGGFGAGICRACWDTLLPFAGPLCPRCGLPFATERALESSDARCAECRRGEFAFDLARSFGLYSANLRAAILQLKFHRRERLGRKLGGLLASTWPSLMTPDADEPPILLPVPLHRSRQSERGYNQAELLAAGLAKELALRRGESRLRVDTRSLKRLRSTPPQTGLTTSARQENVRGVFAVTSPEHVVGKTIVLVDDVMTTGATVSACAEVLKRSGARHVLVLALARATPQFPDIVAARESASDPASGAATRE